MTMPPFFERLDHEEAVVHGELAVLREKTAVLEERLARLVITRETALSLMNDQTTQTSTGSPLEPIPAGAAQSTPPAGSGPLELELARERILVLLAGAHQAMKVQDIGEAIGEVPDRVETTRARLKKMVTEGLVSEVSPAWFAITPAARQMNEQASEEGETA
ncbi:hypothetical protein [Streptomyces fractus]|uniref:hypothetical protein n=1 Tax=Streptomyces fractus TaxID=641806 RepID=UPI003CF92F49